MLGPVCCGLSAVGNPPSNRSPVRFEGSFLHTQKTHSPQSAKVALPTLHPSSPRAHSLKLVTRAPATASLSRTFRRSDAGTKSLQDASLPSNQETCGHMFPCSSMTSFHNHASSCILAADGKVGATIWHALLPARHLTPLECDSNLPSIRSLSAGRSGIDPVANMILGSPDPTLVSVCQLRLVGWCSIARILFQFPSYSCGTSLSLVYFMLLRSSEPDYKIRMYFM